LATGVLLLFPRDYRKVFLLAAIPGLLGLASIIFFVKEAKRDKTERLGKISLKDFSPRYYAFMVIIFIFTLGNSTDALLLIKASDIGILDSFIPMIYLIFNAVSVLFAIPAGMLSDKIVTQALDALGAFASVVLRYQLVSLAVVNLIVLHHIGIVFRPFGCVQLASVSIFGFLYFLKGLVCFGGKGGVQTSDGSVKLRV